MFRRKNDEVAQKYSKDMDYLAKVLLNIDGRLKNLEKKGDPSVLEKIYKFGYVSPVMGVLQHDLLQLNPQFIPVGGELVAFDKGDFRGKGFLENFLCACSSNLLGMQVTLTLRGKETTSFRGTVLDLIALGRINPNSRPPSGGLFCTLVGAPIWVVEAEIPSITLRPFDELVIRLYNADVVPVAIQRCTLAYLYYV